MNHSEVEKLYDTNMIQNMILSVVIGMIMQVSLEFWTSANDFGNAHV